MKKVLIFSILVIFLGSLTARDSDPSEPVGFVKYGCVTTTGTNLNAIALPMDSGYVMASDLGNANQEIDVIYQWNPTTQAWDSATNIGFWLGDFALNDGYPYMVNITADADVYITGGLITQPSYSLITTTGTNLNNIMIPINRSDLTIAGQLGNEIGVCDVVYTWNKSTQAWDSATNIGFWLGDFAIGVSDPLMVNVTSDTSWPVGETDDNTTKRPVKVKNKEE